MKTRFCWHIAVLLSSLLALFACEKSSFTPAHKKRYKHVVQTAQDPPAIPPKDIGTGVKPESTDIKPEGDGGGKPAGGADRLADGGDKPEVKDEGSSSDTVFKDNLASLDSRRTLRPLDVPLAGGASMGGFVPPPVDPFTGGPVAPLPPPPPPLEDGPELPIVPFFVRPICGNRFLTTGKECEDGNLINGDGCSSECKKEFCGNGLIELGEQCDNGVGRNMVQGPNCDQYCQFIICGDFYVTGCEQCDDGNNEDCDGCSRDCKVEDPCATDCCDTLAARAAAAAANAIVSEDATNLGSEEKAPPNNALTAKPH